MDTHSLANESYPRRIWGIDVFLMIQPIAYHYSDLVQVCYHCLDNSHQGLFAAPLLSVPNIDIYPCGNLPAVQWPIIVIATVQQSLPYRTRIYHQPIL